MSSQPNANELPAIQEESLQRFKEVVHKYINNVTDPDKELFHMVREIKADKHLKQLEGYLFIPILQAMLKADGRSVLDLGYEDEDEAIDDLEGKWEDAQLGLEEAPLAAAARLADRHPLVFRTNYASPIYQRLLNIGYYMQQMRRSKPIALPVVVVAKVLRLKEKAGPMRVSRMRRHAAEDDHFLEVVAHHHFYRGQPGEGTKFRFHCEMVNGVMVGTYEPPKPEPIRDDEIPF
jgi:hypothetical protein